MTTKLTIEYDGSGFAGWARQPDERTIQEELERALQTVLGPTGTDGRPLGLLVAGRTDRGVHAWGQIASYCHEAVDPQRLNGLIGADVSVLAAEPAGESFDARRDARSRTYCYRVLARRARSVFERGRAYWWTAAVHPAALDACAAAILGRGACPWAGAGERELLSRAWASAYLHARGPRPPLCWTRNAQCAPHQRRRHRGRRAAGDASRPGGARGRAPRGDCAGRQPLRDGPLDHDAATAVGRGGAVRRRHDGLRDRPHPG